MQQKIPDSANFVIVGNDVDFVTSGSMVDGVGNEVYVVTSGSMVEGVGTSTGNTGMLDGVGDNREQHR